MEKKCQHTAHSDACTDARQRVESRSVPVPVVFEMPRGHFAKVRWGVTKDLATYGR